MDNKFNEEEFLAFLLLYGSHVDIEFSDEEKELVKKVVDNDTYEKIYDLFINMSDYKALETILSHKGLYFPTPTRKAMWLSKMEDLFKVDGDYSSIEKELLLFLNKLM